MNNNYIGKPAKSNWHLDQNTLNNILTLFTPSTLGRPRREEKDIINAIIWKYKTGAPWRDLPSRYPPYTTVHTRLKSWQSDGTWDLILTCIHQQPFLCDLTQRKIKIRSLSDAHWEFLFNLLQEKIRIGKRKRVRWIYDTDGFFKTKTRGVFEDKKGRKVKEKRFYTIYKKKSPRKLSPQARSHVDGLIWKINTNAPWRDIPSRYGNSGAIHSQYSRWKKITEGATTAKWTIIFQQLKEWNYV